jgi:4-hydroxythreonine-4-phosphate dehydrogenase
MSALLEADDRPKIGITIGDVNGIGLEVIMKTFMNPQMLQTCIPIIYGSSKVVSYHRKTLNLNEFNYNQIRFIIEASNKKVNLVNCWDEEIKIEIGKTNPAVGKYALKSLQAASKDLLDKKIDAIVTAPVDKKNMQSDEFKFPGQTEFFANACNAKEYAMLMVGEKLKITFATGHVAVKDIAQSIGKEKIISKIKVLNESLKRDFTIRKPRIAVLALNPHAGDGGLLGNEEIEIIEPAVKECTAANISVYGPYSADGFFGSGKFKSFDGVVAMYHDQGLIPFKALSFTSGVNYTAGLPIIRTSPDHGTGYDIAGKNIASEDSFREAVYLACDIANARKKNDEATANPLKFGKLHAERG